MGLAGSTENWGEILQLGAQIGEYFDLELPLDVVGTGHMQLNGNGFSGLQLVTVGGTAALNAVAGLEVTDNGLWGAISLAQAEDIAANALARVTATSNGNGIAMMAGSESASARDVVDLRFHVGGKPHTVQSSRETAMQLAQALRELSRGA